MGYILVRHPDSYYLGDNVAFLNFSRENKSHILGLSTHRIEFTPRQILAPHVTFELETFYPGFRAPFGVLIFSGSSLLTYKVRYKYLAEHINNFLDLLQKKKY